MSNHRLRNDKTCLNCGNYVENRYCSYCGQENIEPHHSFFGFLFHFISDLFHYENTFFSTIRTVLFQPGVAVKKYMQGQRKRYTDPIKMYIFVSLISLFYLLWLVHYAEYVNLKQHPAYVQAVDSARAAMHANVLDIDVIEIEGNEVLIFNVPDEMRESAAAYEASASFQQKGPVGRAFNRKIARMYDSYDNAPYNFLPAVINKLLHSFSQIFFFSLPFFVVMLSLLFFKRRKVFRAPSHSVFTLYYYCFNFLWLVTLITISDLFENTRFSETLDYFLLWGGLSVSYIYLVTAMKNFYGATMRKALLKSFVLFCVNLIIILLIVIFFFFNSFTAVNA